MITWRLISAAVVGLGQSQRQECADAKMLKTPLSHQFRIASCFHRVLAIEFLAIELPAKIEMKMQKLLQLKLNR